MIHMNENQCPVSDDDNFNDDFREFQPIKFLTILEKAYKSIFEPIKKNIKDLGFNETEFLIMFALAARTSLSIQDIAERIHTTSGNMTFTVDKLEKRGIIERQRCNEDRRKIYLVLTEEGNALWNKLMDEHKAFLSDMFSVLDDKDMQQAMVLLKTIGKTFA